MLLVYYSMISVIRKHIYYTGYVANSAQLTKKHYNLVLFSIYRYDVNVVIANNDNNPWTAISAKQTK